MKKKRLTLLLVAVGLLLAAAALPTIKARAQQSTPVTDDNLNEMIKSAKTPADHEAIAAYYDAEAAENEKKARFHMTNVNMYSKLNFLPHCKALVKAFQDAADQDKALAAAHRAMAKTVGAH
jgi:hypothetical protein